MGDRGNIKCGVEKSVWIYSHWKGSALPVILQKALIEGKGRWGDEAYLNRIIAQAVMEASGERLLGVGISCEITDNEHDILEVDHDAKVVRVLSCEGWCSEKWERKVLREWPFADYVALPTSSLRGVI